MSWPNVPYDDYYNHIFPFTNAYLGGRVTRISDTESLWVINYSGCPAFARITHPTRTNLTVGAFELAQDLYEHLPSNSFGQPPQMMTSGDGVPIMLHKIAGYGYAYGLSGGVRAEPMVLYSIPTGTHVDPAATKLVLFTDKTDNVMPTGFATNSWNNSMSTGFGEGTLVCPYEHGVLAYVGDGWVTGNHDAFNNMAWSPIMKIQEIHSDLTLGTRVSPSWLVPTEIVAGFPDHVYTPAAWAYEPVSKRVMVYAGKIDLVNGGPADRANVLLILDPDTYEIEKEVAFSVSTSIFFPWGLESLDGLSAAGENKWLGSAIGLGFPQHYIVEFTWTGSDIVIKRKPQDTSNPFAVTSTWDGQNFQNFFALSSHDAVSTWGSGGFHSNIPPAFDFQSARWASVGVTALKSVAWSLWNDYDESPRTQELAWPEWHMGGYKVNNTAGSDYLTLLHLRAGGADYTSHATNTPWPHNAHDRVVLLVIPRFPQGAYPPLRQRQRDDGLAHNAPRVGGVLVSGPSGNPPTSKQSSLRQNWGNTYI